MSSKSPECPFESLENTIIFDSLDYGNNKRLAWLYGIVVGWDFENEDNEEDFDITKEFKNKFNWNDDDINRLKRLRIKFLKAKELLNKKEL